MAGEVRLDAPTVQRIGIMVSLQLAASFGWHRNWHKGDITAAFLQGRLRDTEAFGKLYLVPPVRPLAGVPAGSLLRVRQSVYGLPDAPRAWYEELIEALRSMGLEVTRVDSAFLTFRRDGRLTAIMILNVDDLMLATDASDGMRTLTKQVKDRFPFGEWLKVSDEPEGVHYTGRRIRLGTDGEILVDQEEFIAGRLVTLPPCRGKEDLEICDPESQPNFRAAVGGLHWLSS
jgi:hypothetical protein